MFKCVKTHDFMVRDLVGSTNFQRGWVSGDDTTYNVCKHLRDKASVESKKQLEAVYKETARIGGTNLCRIKNLPDDLGWDSLQARREVHKLIIFYKMVNGLTPELSHQIVQNTTTYNLRNSSDMRKIYARTNLFYNSFIPSTIHAWNDLSDEIEAWKKQKKQNKTKTKLKKQNKAKQNNNKKKKKTHTQTNKTKTKATKKKKKKKKKQQQKKKQTKQQQQTKNNKTTY